MRKRLLHQECGIQKCALQPENQPPGAYPWLFFDREIIERNSRSFMLRIREGAGTYGHMITS
jgi:hypothetical protein